MPSTRFPLRKLRVLAAVAVVAALPVSSVLPAAAAVARHGYQKTIDLTFPVRGAVSYADTYWAARSEGRTHQATDIMGRKMQRLFAAKQGVVCYITGVGEKAPSWGMMLTICGADGRQYSYIHMNNDTPGTDDGKSLPRYAYAPRVREGSRVRRGQFIGWMGDSGNAESTAPHLHFEISDPNLRDARVRKPGLDPERINPYFSLKAAERQNDYPGVTYPLPLP
jgi:murein DD-endopeptidase MepM/ murein hydrolase activator NlpD